MVMGRQRRRAHTLTSARLRLSGDKDRASHRTPDVAQE